MAKNSEAPASDTPAPGAAVQIDAGALATIGNEITEMDQKIAAASGNDSQARKAFIEQITASNSQDVDALVASIVSQLKEKPEPVLVGLVTRLNEAVKTDLEPVVNKWVDEEFPKTKSDSKVDVGALKETRKQKLTMFKALREVLNTFKIPNEHIPDPKRVGGGRPVGSATGSGSKSGANKERYRYQMDGKNRPKSQNSISSLCFYATEGVPAKLNPSDPKPRPRWSTPELKDFLKEQGVNFGVDEAWEVKLPNDKVISARRFTPQDLIELEIDETKPDASAAPEEAPANA